MTRAVAVRVAASECGPTSRSRMGMLGLLVAVAVGGLGGTPGLQGVAIGLLLVLLGPVVAVLAGPTPAVVALLATDVLAATGKRIVFMLGDQPEPVYAFLAAAPLLSGALTLGVLLYSTTTLSRADLRPVPRTDSPPAYTGRLADARPALFFLIWIGVAFAAKWDIEGAQDYALLTAGIFPATVAALEKNTARSSRALPGAVTIVAVMTVPFGAIQFSGRLFPWDHAWISGAAQYSAQASKLLNEPTIIRPFSLYADHTTWGLLLIAGLAVTPHVAMPPRRRFASDACLLLGVAMTLTRSIWAGALIALVLRLPLASKSIGWLSRRRRRVAGGLASLLVGGQLAVTWLYQAWVAARPIAPATALAQRVTTLGTLAARTGGVHQATVIALGSSSALLFGVLTPARAEIDSHSLVGDLLLVGGLPAVAAFAVATVRAIRSVAGRPNTHVDWRAVVAISYLVVGLVDGLAVLMVPHFWLAAVSATRHGVRNQ